MNPTKCAVLPLIAVWMLLGCEGMLQGDGPPEDDDPAVDDDDDTPADDDTADDDDTIDEPCEANPYGPIEILTECNQGELSNHQAPLAQGATALRYLGVYEVLNHDHHQLADLEVHVELDHPTVLALNAYEPTRWIVTEAVPGTLVEIIINGYYEPEIEAPAGVPVSIYSHDQGNWLWSSAYHWYDHDTRELVPLLESMTGLQLTSFAGCYDPASFTLRETCEPDTEEPGPDCSQEGEALAGPDHDVLDGICEDIQAEDYWCLALTGSNVVLLGLDSGDICDVAPQAMIEGYSPSSIAWMGEHVYACSGPYNSLSRVSLVDGQVDRSFGYCDAVAAYDDGLLTEELGKIQHGEARMWYFDTFLDAQCERGDEWIIAGSKSRMTVCEDTLYYGWHSTDVVYATDLPSAASVDAIWVEDYDTWINGMSVMDNELLVLSATWPQDRVVVFDVETGFELWEVEQSTHLKGLSCFSK